MNILSDMEDDELLDMEGENEDMNNLPLQDQNNLAMANSNSKAGRWTDEEHERFLEALGKFGKNWNKVHRYVGTRTSAQTRSHA